VITVGVSMGWYVEQATSNAVRAKPAMILRVDFIMCEIKKLEIVIHFRLLTSFFSKGMGTFSK
jgi:hypothetical protein